MNWQPLIDAARDAREHSYAPYSDFRVGVAIEWTGGETVSGTNVENSSYGLTVCAERNTVAAAIRQGMKRGQLEHIAIVAHAEAVTPPCGACRQVLAEFAAPHARLLLVNLRDASHEEVPFWDLLPHAFIPESLPDE